MKKEGDELEVFDIDTEQTVKNKERINCVFSITAIHYVISGKGYFNGKTINPGEGFICFENNLVDYYPDYDDPWKYTFVRLSNAKVNDIICDVDYTFKFNLDELFYNTVSYVTNNIKELTKNIKFSNACANLFNSLHYTDENSKRYSIAFENAQRAKYFIESNYHKQIIAEDAAKYINVSRAYLRNIFYNYYNISPQQYIIELRVKNAESLLINTKLQITEIALMVGYSDPLQFSKIFKRYNNISPKGYRETKQGAKL